ncbi:uncharacterized protein LOC105829566 [Monomorium pharaonis]|uniref:uncharacterized protein LOC105829566 n=1 Tax=Monomorium pharaonis TaxID=307658 RepID=UPI001746329E|nr:uncharacterized protein LOC105829566 [Monomorium pharaonis]
MKNSTVKSGSSILPPIRSTEHRTFNKKNDLVKALPSMIDNLSIDENAKQNITSKLNQNSTARKEIKERDFKLTASLYDIDGMSFEELQTSLCRITENPREPFSFLANISDKFVSDDKLSTKPTEIDMQLAAVAKRIESSKILLEEAKTRIENMYLQVKQNDICRAWKEHDVCDDKVKEEQLS